MSYLRLPPRTARQPLGRPGIRWNDPLTRGLVLAAPDGWRDAASGRYATLDNAPTYGPHASLRGDVGIAQTFASSQKITFTLPEGMTRPLSVACIAYLTDRNAAEEVATVKAGSNYYGILGRGDTAGNQAQAASSGGSFRARISIGSAYAARRVIVATFEPGPLNVADPVYNIYVDGVAGTSYSVQSSPINDVATVLASGSYTGVVSGLFVWNRVIDADEVKALGIDNWQMFAPDVRRVHFLGPSAGTNYTLSVSPATITFAGQTAGVRAARKLAVTAGAVSFSGQATGALYGRRLPISPATIGISGQTAGVKATRMLPVAFGEVTFTGATVAPLYGRTLTVEPGSITFNGASIGMQYGSDTELAVDPGTLTVTGATVGMRYGRVLGITAGSLTITGQTVNMRATRLLGVTPGAVTFTGAAVGMSYGRTLGVSPGSIAFTGQTVNARVHRVLTVTPGSILISGAVIGTDYSGEIITFDPRRMAMIPLNLRELRVPLSLRELRVPSDDREIQA